MNRRQFLILSSAVAIGCDRREGPVASTQPTSNPSGANIVDAGAIDAFKTDAVYDQFREQGFFIIRREKTLFALSAICTHKGCKVRAQSDQSFLCKCHGSTFDASGQVTKGPAKQDLPRLRVKADRSDHLLVDLNSRSGR
ncbi:hypothetical protein BH09PLA1_BH09PLA1_32450 [soil metagenome]